MMISESDRRAVRTAWIGWAALFIVTASIIAAGSSRTVVPAYRIASLHWLAGQGLYDGMGVGGFVYLPQAAILFVPFALLPVVAGEVLWRLFNIGVFAIGIRGFSRLAGGRSETELFPLMTLVTLPLTWDCARNGQATVAMTGLMLLAVVDLTRRHWWRATLWLALSVSLKPLAVVLALLVLAIDRAMTWRMILAAIAVALLPFLMQHSSYVLDQYASFLHNTTTAAHVGVVKQGWAHLFSALRVLGMDVPERFQTLVRLGAAAGTLGLYGMVRRRFDPVRSAVSVFTLAVVYLVLFSPRTENNTYMLLGPAVALFLGEAILIEKRYVTGVLLSGLALGMLIGRMLQRTLAPQAEAIWLSPLLATGFAAYLLVRLFTDPMRREDRNGEDSAVPQAASPVDTADTDQV
jgi:hypothetical protein